MTWARTDCGDGNHLIDASLMRCTECGWLDPITERCTECDRPAAFDVHGRLACDTHFWPREPLDFWKVQGATALKAKEQKP